MDKHTKMHKTSGAQIQSLNSGAWERARLCVSVQLLPTRFTDSEFLQNRSQAVGFFKERLKFSK